MNESLSEVRLRRSSFYEEGERSSSVTSTRKRGEDGGGKGGSTREGTRSVRVRWVLVEDGRLRRSGPDY